MRRKQLNGIAASIAHKFASSAEHFAYIAYTQKIQAVDIDFLTLKIAPAIFDIARNHNLVRYCRENLFQLIEVSELKQATLNLVFDIKISQSKPLSILSAIYQMQLVDSEGKVAEHLYNQPNQLIQP